MELIAVGANHRTAPVEVRDALHVGPERIEAFRDALKGAGERVAESVVLSTCNRTEVYGLVGEGGLETLGRAAEGVLGGPWLLDERHAYHLADRDAARHLFRVASGTDSLLVGEPQILGQVRDAHKLAHRLGSTGPVLTRLFETAIRTGRRARSETEIGAGTVSVAYAGVSMALKVFDGLSRHAVAVVGAGETGALVAEHLAERRPGRLWVVNRTPAAGIALADRVGGEYRPLDHLDEILEEAVVVVTATSAGEVLVDRRRVERALEGRRGGLVLVDLSSPRNVSPDVAELDRVFHYDLDALEGIAEQNRARRAREIPRVEAIVEDEVERFFAWYGSLDAVPVLRALRDRFHEIGLAEVERHGRGLDDADREALGAFARGLVNKLLHQPTTRISDLDARSSHGLRRLVAVQELFELDLDPYRGGNGASPPPARDPAPDAATPTPDDPKATLRR